MSRIISRAESWEKAYEAFQTINFSAFDFNTIKESMVEYIKLYFPEDFNDYIESSEFIAILELFAYLGELVAYRLDLNAHENFITTAQRKESVLRLAKLISYNPSRNLPARGLVKIESITTTEQVYDSNGLNLAGVTIKWNDINNSNWKEQFLLVMNRVLQQDFGSVAPNERVQIDDVLFELYEWNNSAITNGVFPYTVSVSGNTLPFELVPSGLNEYGPYERRPDSNASFSLLYGTDGLGDASDTTGFFIFTKQGTLTSLTTTFDGVTPNQTHEIAINNINETDIWVNNVDPATNEIIDAGLSGAYDTRTEGKSGEWQEVDLAHAQNIIFNTNPSRNKYEVETLDNDQVRIIFGDGEYADIPSGTFQIWYRVSANEDVYVPQNAIINKSGSFTYLDENDSAQTLSFTFSSINSYTNASASEDLEHIRNVAPAVYYTQDRMVNNRDYNTFMLQDPTILKLRAINRTFAGDSKYMEWHDGSESYENVKLVGDDLVLYFKLGESTREILNESRVNVILTNYIEPLLSSTDFFTILTSRGMEANQIRRVFNQAERIAISDALTDATIAPPTIVHLYFSIAKEAIDDNGWSLTPDLPYTDWIDMITVVCVTNSSWTITHRTERIIAESQSMNFWNTNNADTVIDYDTLNSGRDKIVVLSANKDATRRDLLTDNQSFEILGHENIELGLPSAGLVDIHKLSVLPEDINNDNVADDMELATLLNPSWNISVSAGNVYINGSLHSTLAALPGNPISIKPPFIFLNRPGNIIINNDYQVDGDVDGSLVTIEARYAGIATEYNTPSDELVISGLGGNTVVNITVGDYVYFQRPTSFDDFVPMANTYQNIQDYVLEFGSVLFETPIAESNYLHKRERGRSNLNFMWLHFTPRFHLVDPAATNIIDIFIISKGYYTAIRKWLDGKLTNQPQPPTPLELRTSYAHMIDNKMISDTIVLHPGKIKMLFGDKALPGLQAKFRIVRGTVAGSLTDNQIKVKVVDTIKAFFDINLWEFGETFYFTELSAAIHSALASEIDTVVLVPRLNSNQFGDLFQIFTREDEILQPDITVADVEIVESLTPQTLRQQAS